MTVFQDRKFIRHSLMNLKMYIKSHKKH